MATNFCADDGVAAHVGSHPLTDTKYPRAVRLAIVVGSSVALWAAILALIF